MYGIATQPTAMAIYVDARGAHWLLGSLSVLTAWIFSNILAEMPRDAPEKAKTKIRKINGMKGFFSSSLCPSCQRVGQGEHVENIANSNA